jgi:hypothetical protein
VNELALDVSAAVVWGAEVLVTGEAHLVAMVKAEREAVDSDCFAGHGGGKVRGEDEIVRGQEVKGVSPLTAGEIADAPKIYAG